jgi:uncharacterized membrane protein
MQLFSWKAETTLASGLTLLFMLALGPGIWGSHAASASESIPYFQMFRGLCHQLPDRCYTFNGWLMPVCSRCIGIYGGLALGWILSFLLIRLARIGKDFQKSLLGWITFSIFVANIIDYLGNVLGFWTNSLFSRLLMGFALSISLIFYLRGKSTKRS